MGTAIKHPVPDRVKTSFVIFDIRALWRSENLDVKNYKWRLNPSCSHTATVGVKGLIYVLLGFASLMHATPTIHTFRWSVRYGCMVLSDGLGRVRFGTDWLLQILTTAHHRLVRMEGHVSIILVTTLVRVRLDTLDPSAAFRPVRSLRCMFHSGSDKIKQVSK